MLKLISENKRKVAAQTHRERVLKNSLKDQEIRTIGFQGGNFDQTVYAAGDKNLWAVFTHLDKTLLVPRFWNAFGIYKADRPALTPTVEINIPTNSNATKVAGFFAEDIDSENIF